MYFTGIRTQFLKSTGFKSYGFISHDDENETSTMTWLEANYRPSVKAWEVQECTRTSNTESQSDVSKHIKHGCVTLQDAVKHMHEFEAAHSDVEIFDIWPGERNLHLAEGIIKDREYSLRHKIMNIGLPKL